MNIYIYIYVYTYIQVYICTYAKYIHVYTYVHCNDSCPTQLIGENGKWVGHPAILMCLSSNSIRLAQVSLLLGVIPQNTNLRIDVTISLESSCKVLKGRRWTARSLWVAHSWIARRCPPSVPNKCSDIMDIISSFHMRLRNAFPFSAFILRLQQ